MRLLLIALLSLSVSCSFADPDSNVANSCLSDSQCGLQAVCNLEVGRCESTLSRPIRLGLEVVPNPEDTILPWAFVEPAFSGDTVDLVMPSRVKIVGTVRWRGERVPAEISFLDTHPLPGQQTFTSVVGTLGSVVEGDASPDGMPADYVTTLSGGHNYDILVQPINMNQDEVPWFRILPPMRFSNINTPNPEDGAVLITRVDITFPEGLEEPCSSDRAATCKLKGSLISNDEDAELSGMQVRAVDSETGHVVSSTAITEDGKFELQIGPNATKYVLRVTSGETLFPTLTIDPKFFFPGEEAKILVPSQESVIYEGTVELSDGSLLPNANLAFESLNVFDETTRAVGQLKLKTTTELDGSFSLELLPGTYNVIISASSADSRAPAVISESIHIVAPEEGKAIRGQLFTVPERARLGGDVIAANDLPVGAVTVEATPRGIPIGSDVPIAAEFNRFSDAATDDTGRFSLRLDLGAYDIVLKPPRSLGFGWIVAPSFLVGSVGQGSAPFSSRYEFEPPVPLTGVVLNSDGTPVTEAIVKVYAEVTEDNEVRSIVVGRGQTDESGRYEVLMPPTLR